MMTETQFLNRFQRQPNGEWACTKPIKINGHPSGPAHDRGRNELQPGSAVSGTRSRDGTRSYGGEASFAGCSIRLEERQFSAIN